MPALTSAAVDIVPQTVYYITPQAAFHFTIFFNKADISYRNTVMAPILEGAGINKI